MFSLQPPRHISTLPLATVGPKKAACRYGPKAAIAPKGARAGRCITYYPRTTRMLLFQQE